MSTPRPARPQQRAHLARIYRRRRTAALLIALTAAAACAYLVFGSLGQDQSAAPAIRISEQPVLYPVTHAPEPPASTTTAAEPQGPVLIPPTIAAVSAPLPAAECGPHPAVRTGQEQKFHHRSGACRSATD